MAHILSQFAPLHETDSKNKIEMHLIKKWRKHLPNDPRFYRLILQQLELWKKFKDKTLLEFIQSAEGRKWFKSRKKINRRAYFELDQVYKSTRKDALRYEEKIRGLIRENPLLTYKDLKSLGIRNAQLIWERFPQRMLHRERALASIAKRLDA